MTSKEHISVDNGGDMFLTGTVLGFAFLLFATVTTSTADKQFIVNISRTQTLTRTHTQTHTHTHTHGSIHANKDKFQLHRLPRDQSQPKANVCLSACSAALTSVFPLFTIRVRVVLKLIM